MPVFSDKFILKGLSLFKPDYGYDILEDYHEQVYWGVYVRVQHTGKEWVMLSNHIEDTTYNEAELMELLDETNQALTLIQRLNSFESNRMIKVYSHTPIDHDARTLAPVIGLQESGWTIEAEIMEDYYEWINHFKATHPKYGTVEGDFESEVYATSQEAYDHFIANHPYNDWDYWDI